MDNQLNRLNQLQRKIKILDGYDDSVKREVINLQEFVNQTKLIIAERKEILQKNKKILQDQKLLIDRLMKSKERLAYMAANYPRGMVRIINDSDSQMTPQEVQPETTVRTQFNNTNNMNTKRMQCTPPPSPPLTDRTAVVPTPKPRRDMEISVSYVSNAEFQNVPDYMKGRFKVTDINTFIDVYNKTLSKKYELLKKAKNTVKAKNELDKFIKWKSQINSDTKGDYFCTSEDFYTESGLKLGKREFSYLTIMRHLKKIKELRNKKLIYYVACF